MNDEGAEEFELAGQLERELTEDSTDDEAPVITSGEIVTQEDLSNEIFTPVRQDDQYRIMNRTFSLAEYDTSWTKIERYFFIEIFNIIKEFYLAKDDKNIYSMTGENITVKLPIQWLDPELFSSKNRRVQLMAAVEGLMNKKIRSYEEDTATGQIGFDFITMFPRITYRPNEDKKHIYIRIQSEVYDEMIPIQSYARLDLKLIKKINSGNTLRIYEILKSFSYLTNFEISFTDLRRKLGFYEEKKYPEWKFFNYKVLKPAVENINNHKEYDIEVSYKKVPRSEMIKFTVIEHADQQKHKINVLSLNDRIDPESRLPNMVQRKYIKTTLAHCMNVTPISNIKELTEWVVSDIINQQEKQGKDFDFKKLMNAISHQIRHGKYSEPYAHKHLSKKAPNKVSQFDDAKYREIAKLDMQGKLQEIRDRFTNEELFDNQAGHLIETFKLEGIVKSEA